MENENKTKKTEQRVVLNLSMDQARGMIDLLDLALNETIQTPRRELGMTLKKRIQKTINKHENSEDQALGHELAEIMGVTGPEGA